MFEITFELFKYNHVINITMTDFIGWIGNLFLIIGIILIGNKDVKGFYFSIIASIIYGYQSILLSMSSLLALEIITFVLYIRGIKKWKK